MIILLSTHFFAFPDFFPAVYGCWSFTLLPCTVYNDTTLPGWGIVNGNGTEKISFHPRIACWKLHIMNIDLQLSLSICDS
jgi:hypothetical protein